MSESKPGEDGVSRTKSTDSTGGSDTSETTGNNRGLKRGSKPQGILERVRASSMSFVEPRMVENIQQQLQKKNPNYGELSPEQKADQLTELLREYEERGKYESIYGGDDKIRGETYEQFKKMYATTGSRCTHALIEVYFQQRQIFMDVDPKNTVRDKSQKMAAGDKTKKLRPRDKLQQMWPNVLKSLEERFEDEKVYVKWGYKQASRMHTYETNTKSSEVGLFNTSSGGGWVMSEEDILLGMVRYQTLPTYTLRAKHGRSFNQMKEHLRIFFRPTYNMYQQLSWMFSQGALQYVFGASVFVDTARRMYDTVVNGVTLGPVVLGNMIVNEFLGTMTKTVPTIGQTNLAVISACFVAIAVVSEAYLVHTSKDYRSLLKYLLKESNKVIIHSSYEWQGVFKIVVRILENFGARRTGMILQAMSALQSPYDAFKAFQGMSSYKSLDRVVKESRSSGDMGSYFNRLLREFQGSRTIQRASTGFSILGFNTKKNYYRS